MKCREIAQFLGKPNGTIKKYLSRARTKLKTDKISSWNPSKGNLMSDTVWLFNKIPNSKMEALTAIFYLLTISSCLSLTPPIEKPNSPKKENSK